MTNHQANDRVTGGSLGPADGGAKLPSRAREVVERYVAADFNHRMSMWLEYRDLRGAFDVVERAEYAPASKPRGIFRWLRLGRAKPPVPAKRHYAA